MKPRSTEYKHDWRQLSLLETGTGQGGLPNDSGRVAIVRVLTGHSVEELLDEVSAATEEGFERQGMAYFDGEKRRPFRQVMVRYDGPSPPRTPSVRKRTR